VCSPHCHLATDRKPTAPWRLRTRTPVRRGRQGECLSIMTPERSEKGETGHSRPLDGRTGFATLPDSRPAFTKINEIPDQNALNSRDYSLALSGRHCGGVPSRGDY